MVRRVKDVIPGPPPWYVLACGHNVPAQDYNKKRGLKEWAWCAACWMVEEPHPTGTSKEDGWTTLK